jgi:hypothetical protein
MRALTWSVTTAVVALSFRSSSAEPGEGDVTPTHTAAEDVEDGDMLPWMVGAKHDHRELQVQMMGGRDTSTGTTTFSSSVEATLIDRVALRTTFANDGYDPRLRPTAGIVVDALRQRDAGVDLALGAVYETKGYNEVPALVLHAAVARRFGPTTLLANATYGAGLARGERYGAAGVGAIARLADHWYAGVASQAHVDLERDDVEPAEERDWDVNAGPVASYTYGAFVVSASAGIAAWQFRLHPEQHVGPVGLLGAGAVF